MALERDSEAGPGWPATILQSLAWLAVMTLAVAWVVVMSALPRLDGTLPVAGIRQGAAIARDHLGVPRITARSADDAYFALGWAHAQDRMWQMELQRRVGAGRLAELVGEAGLANDRFMRTLDIYAQAERSVPHLDAATRAALLSYADGVNAWLTMNRLRLPLEYSVLGARPEPWRPADSLVWAKLMALQLAGDWRDDVVRAQLARMLPAGRIRELFPAYPADAPVTLAAEAGDALLAAVPDDARPRPASNIWVVAGSRTASGKPLLANDPHLGFRAPILWYLAEIDTPGLALTGATVPGLPFHLIAHNGAIAWGFTATQADSVDLFAERLAGAESYLGPDGPLPFRRRDEVIRIKGGGEETLRVRETRHGPVISDLVGQDLAGPDLVLAFSATALADPDLSVQALHRLNRARDWAGFTAALESHHAPVLNIGYADTAGGIGFRTAGRLPLRRSGDGSLPVPGWTGEGDWTGWVPFERMPQGRDPASGLLINANNRPVDAAYPYLVSANWLDSFRARRLGERLNRDERHTAGSMAALQGDVLSIQAVELKTILAGRKIVAEPAAGAARMVAAWDGAMERGRPEPLIFTAWANRLYRAVFADELKERFEPLSSIRALPLAEALTRPGQWCDDVATPAAETCDELIERSLTQAVAELTAAWGPEMGRWKWGEAHPARFESPVLGRVPLLERLANLEIASGGDDFTVARAAYRTEAGMTRFPQIHGAGLRVVFDLANLADSRFVLATGQSGHPLSRHYSSMMEAWRDNRLAWPTGRRERTILTLAPERQP